MTKTLSGKAALVTGGSRGIGAAIVRRLAADGASVAFTYAASDRQAEALVAEIAGAGGRTVAIKADSADPDAVKGAVRQAADRLGGLDILVNNAGILTLGLIDDYSLDDFDRMVAVNVRAVFVGTQAALPYLKEGGRIITTGSVAADRTGFPGGAVYSMTKAAVASLTRGLARDLGPRGITVNAVEPGPIETDMSSDPQLQEIVRPLIALGRLGKDREVASLVSYLAGPEAGFVTGATLRVDGGYMA